ncbi:putative carboxypeptidase s precursor [Naematelia encephala]|uniref:Putative carboxypeptidase s n=1 Tax=Naematelia encephala TaxID=71784 RepID=A0A1Y2BCB7_9TREE|nr:putative carboxypeptidase s precursor [Naematelia encephala]
MTKGAIYLPTSVDRPSKSQSKWPKWLFGAAALAGTLFVLYPTASEILLQGSLSVTSRGHRGELCKQSVPRLPETFNTSTIWSDRRAIIDKLSGVVQIRTETFDDMGLYGEDPRWDNFAKLHDFLEEHFPLVHTKLKVTKPGPGLALIYEWAGTDSSLKPLLFTAHQDTVPVLEASLDQWEQPPFSGHYDGTYVWGRGSSDTKSSLIAVLSALEHLLASGYTPKRTVIAGFGSDEESGGPYGAILISKYLKEKYGDNSIALLVDEGSGLVESYGQAFGTPGVTEKGSANIEITVETLGGHSSVPPEHTGIGLLALAIAEVEKHPYAPTLPTFSPIYGFLTCAASHAQGLSEYLRQEVFKAEDGNARALKDLPSEFIKVGFTGVKAGPGQGNVIQALMSTTQATDIVRGGVKVNALPEVVSAKINHRINVESNGAEVEAKLVETLTPLAKTYNLTLTGPDGKDAVTGGKGRISLSDGGRYGDPAPISPFDVSDPVWDVLAGTSRGVWASRREISPDGKLLDLEAGKDLVMAPFMSTGNTDTRYYWAFTDNIYRYRYQPMAGTFGAHTVNEHTNADDVVEMARFYLSLVVNFDEAEGVL